MKDPFRIFHIDADEAARVGESLNPPHSHDYEELIIGEAGSLTHFIDFKSDSVQAPLVSFVTKGKMHRVQPHAVNGACSMWVLRFKSEFIPETTFQLYALYHGNANLALQDGPAFRRMLTLCHLLDAEMQAETPDFPVVRHLLSALFSMVESERNRLLPAAGNPGKNPGSVFTDFLQLLEAHFRTDAGVEFYASELAMTARNLNHICRRVLQQSVSEIIETRKLIEAKNLLASTDKTVAEIGFELGYNEKSYFSAVFKRKAGQTPTEFRNEIRKML